MLDRLNSIKNPKIVISGASLPQMEVQLAGLECTLMPQSGNFMPMWRNTLSKADLVEIYAHMSSIRVVFPKHFNITRKDHIDNRGCQTSLSFTGHGADYNEKISFDPKHKIRKHILDEIPFKHLTLDCTIAGTTCFDYTRKDCKKGNNIKRYIEHMNWSPNECIYFGDALFKGGNDESVIGVIDTFEVSGPYELLTIISNI